MSVKPSSKRLSKLRHGLLLACLMLSLTACKTLPPPAVHSIPDFSAYLVPVAGPASLKHGASNLDLAGWGAAWRTAAQTCEADKASIAAGINSYLKDIKQ